MPKQPTSLGAAAKRHREAKRSGSGQPQASIGKLEIRYMTRDAARRLRLAKAAAADIIGAGGTTAAAVAGAPKTPVSMWMLSMVPIDNWWHICARHKRVLFWCHCSCTGIWLRAGSDEDDREQGGEVSRGDAFIGSGGAGSAAGMFMQDATIEQISRMTL